MRGALLIMLACGDAALKGIGIWLLESRACLTHKADDKGGARVSMSIICNATDKSALATLYVGCILLAGWA